MLLCICASVHVSVNEWLIFSALMKLQCIVFIFTVILFMHYGEFSRGVLSTLIKFG